VLSDRVTIAFEVPNGFNDADAFKRIASLVIALLMAGMSPDLILRRLTKEPDQTGVVQ